MGRLINTEVPLTEKNQNANIKANILEDKEMRKLGFTDHNKSTWYYFRDLGNDVGFNVRINKENKQIEIDVLDENFGQLYQYQSMLINGNRDKFILDIHNKVQKEMKRLMELGIIYGYELGDYI